MENVGNNKRYNTSTKVQKYHARRCNQIDRCFALCLVDIAVNIDIGESCVSLDGGSDCGNLADGKSISLNIHFNEMSLLNE